MVKAICKAIAAAMLVACVPAGVALAGNAGLQAQQLTNSTVAEVDFGGALTELTAGDPASYFLRAGSDFAEGYELYDESWETADGASAHANEAEQAKASAQLGTIEADVTYYYSISFKTVDGNVFSDDVTLTELGVPVAGAAAYRELSADKETVTFKKFRSSVGGQAVSRALDFGKAKLSWTSRVYNAKVQRPTVKGVALPNGSTAHEGEDYQVFYSPAGSKAAGAYKLTVAGDNGLSGSKSFTYKIVPKGTSIGKVTPGKKKLTVNWKKQAVQTSGYEIRYSTDKRFSKSTTKTVVVKGSKATGKTVKKLAANKKYYLQIRTYKASKSVKVASKWSAIKSAKTK